MPPGWQDTFKLVPVDWQQTSPLIKGHDIIVHGISSISDDIQFTTFSVANGSEMG